MASDSSDVFHEPESPTCSHEPPEQKDPKAPSKRLSGEVTRWHDKGWGFIHFSDGRLAYVHISQCGGEQLRQGQKVIAAVVADPQKLGKWQAKRVKREVMPKPGPGARMQGVVMEWNSKGFGFAAFADGRRGYIHKTQVQGGSLNIGQLVSAVLEEDTKNKGKWRAKQLMRVSQTFEPGRVEGEVVRWSSKGYGFIHFNDGRSAYVHNSECGGEDLLQGEQVTAIVQADVLQPSKWSAHKVLRGPLGEDGVVTHWEAKHGYGFMQLDDGRRAYVHRTSFGGSGDLEIGLRLRVDVMPDTRGGPGKWKVIDVKAEVSPARLDSQPAVQPRPITLSGVVTSWHPEGYGFLMMQDGRRVYVHSSACEGPMPLVEGECLSAVVVPDVRSNGKWMARSVKRGMIGEDAVVLDWIEEGGYGFIEVEDGRKAYIHRSHFGGKGELRKDQRMRAVITKDVRNPGKWCVERVLSKELLVSEVGVPSRPSLLLAGDVRLGMLSLG